MHGPCKLTGKPVFGHNIFSDLVSSIGYPLDRAGTSN